MVHASTCLEMQFMYAYSTYSLILLNFRIELFGFKDGINGSKKLMWWITIAKAILKIMNSSNVGLEKYFTFEIIKTR